MNDISKLLEKKELGDIKVVARILGLSQNHVSKILSRPKSKRYQTVIESLGKVIQSREDLVNNN